MLRFASGHKALDPETETFYRNVLQKMSATGIPFLVGGAYAFAGYTGIVRHTKDLDLFLSPQDCQRALDHLAQAGYRVEMTDPIWLAKIFFRDAFVDFIFRSGNGISEVDAGWFDHAKSANLFDVPVRLCSPEETIWSKAFIMERDRYDGADVAHYLLVWGEQMDWERLLHRFGEHWRVLLSHLVLFGFIYPERRSLIPRELMERLLDRLRGELDADESTSLCQGTLLSRVHYLVDTGPWGLTDARFEPRGTITKEEVEKWRRQAEGERDVLLQRSGIYLDEVPKRPSALH